MGFFSFLPLLSLPLFLIMNTAGRLWQWLTFPLILREKIHDTTSCKKVSFSFISFPALPMYLGRVDLRCSHLIFIFCSYLIFLFGELLYYKIPYLIRMMDCIKYFILYCHYFIWGFYIMYDMIAKIAWWRVILWNCFLVCWIFWVKSLHSTQGLLKLSL